MKKLAELFLYFCLSFVIIFLAATGFRFLASWVEIARVLPQAEGGALLEVLAAAALWALPAALYGSLLLGLNYTARKLLPLPVAVLCMIVVSLAFGFAASLGIGQLRMAAAGQMHVGYIGGSGLILSNRLTVNETAIVLLYGAREPRGPRVVALPNQPLIFQEEAPPIAVIHMPPIPFTGESPWFLQNIALDLHLSSLNIERQIHGSFAQFLINTGALVFFISSLGFIFYFSAWPLANVLLGALALRGVLALETFLNTPDIYNIYAGFIGNWLPMAFALPAVLVGLGSVMHIFSVLVFILKRRKSSI
ncbi:MAG: hypothetical protein FWG66_09605 [Spirochaetes bacterium]|nr:hypothetical protein [Spirochaetota bacterium]